MSAELPDFDQNEWWLDSEGAVWNCPLQTDEMSTELKLELAPWEPLRTADDWASRIDRDKLAHVMEVPLLGRARGSRTTNRAVADAVLAALPELTKEET